MSSFRVLLLAGFCLALTPGCIEDCNPSWGGSSDPDRPLDDITGWTTGRTTWNCFTSAQGLVNKSKSVFLQVLVDADHITDAENFAIEQTLKHYGLPGSHPVTVTCHQHTDVDQCKVGQNDPDPSTGSGPEVPPGPDPGAQPDDGSSESPEETPGNSEDPGNS